MQAPSLLAFLSLAGCASGCTGLGYVDRYVPAQVQGCERGFERVEPSPHVVGGAGWRLGGTPLAVRLRTNKGRFRIQCHEFGWNAYTVGPILPVLPNFWAAGNCFPPIEVQVLLESGSAPVSIAPAEFLVSTGSRPLGHPPASCAREADESAPVVPGSRIRLEPGQSVWLLYPDEFLENPEFELSCGFSAPEEQAREPLRIHFAQERTPFLFHAP